MLSAMAQACTLCGKKKNIAWRLVKLRGKYNPTIKHAQKPNLQWMHLSRDDSAKWGLPFGERIKACTKCIKAAAKSK